MTLLDILVAGAHLQSRHMSSIKADVSLTVCAMWSPHNRKCLDSSGLHSSLSRKLHHFCLPRSLLCLSPLLMYLTRTLTSGVTGRGRGFQSVCCLQFCLCLQQRHRLFWPAMFLLQLLSPPRRYRLQNEVSLRNSPTVRLSL